MLLKIGIIGVGAFGNKIVHLAKTNEFPTWMINSSETDIEAIASTEKEGFVIGKEGGCGKERTSAKRLVKENFKAIVANVPKNILECDVVFVVGSSDGGTGSGMLPILTEILRSAFPEIHFAILSVYPIDSICPAGLVNTIEMQAEISDNHASDISYIMFDNNKIKGSLKRVYETINDDIIEALRIMRGDLITPSSLANIDRKDLLKLSVAPGMTIINKIEGISSRDFDNKDISDMIIESIKSNHNVDFERDGVITSMGVITVLEKNVYENVMTDYTKVKNFIGVPKEIFEHMQYAEKPEESCIVTVMTGLSAPVTRLNDLKNSISDDKDRIGKTSGVSTADIRQAVNWFDNSSNVKERKNDTQACEIDMKIFSKY